MMQRFLIDDWQTFIVEESLLFEGTSYQNQKGLVRLWMKL